MKRNISIIFILVIISSCFQISVLGYDDITADTEFSSDIKLLTAVGILNGKSESEFDPSGSLTRAEFVTIIMKLINMNANPSETIYADVSSDYWAADAILTMSGLGYINGINGSSFAPDASVTYAQAVKILVEVLGYGSYGQMYGGYPAGYMRAAEEKRMLSGLSMSYEAELTRAQAAKLISNACDIDVLIKDDTYSGSFSYHTEKGRTLLWQYHRIYKIKNVKINGNSVTMLSGASNLADDTVRLDFSDYKKGKTDIDRYLGYIADVYYHREDGETAMTIVHYTLASGKNRTLTISAALNDGVSGGKISYRKEKDGNILSASIPLTADVIYNGKAEPFSQSLFNFDNGAVTLLDADDDNSYEIVIIEEFVNVTIGSIDYRDKKIYGKDTFAADLGFSTDCEYKIFDMSAEDEILFSDLSVDDFISVAASKDLLYTQIYLCNISISGRVEEISGDTITIAGVTYSTANSLFNDKDGVKLGAAGTFYFDKSGNIGKGVLELDDITRYGYFMGLGEKGFGTLKIQLLTDSGKVEILNAAAKIIVDGVSADYAALQNTLKTDYSQSSPAVSADYVRQVIRYRLNSDGEIKEIDTLYDNGEGTDALHQDAMNVRRLRKYKLYAKSFLLEFNIAADTVIFRVPDWKDSSVTSSFADDVKNYDVVDTGYFAHDADYTVEAYDCREGKVAKVMLVYIKGNDDVKNSASLCLVDKISKVADEEGQETLKMYCLSGGKHVEYLAKTASVFDITAGTTTRQLKQGDVIRISTDKNGKITNVTVDLNIDLLNTSEKGYNGNFMTDFYEFKGRVTQKGNGYFTVDTQRYYNSAVENIELFPIAGGNVYIYDRIRGDISNGSIDDLVASETAGSYVLVRMSYETCREIIIFKE